MAKRQSDKQAMEFDRSPTRTYERDGKWFYATREGEFGPFECEAAANEDVESYVGLVDLRPEMEGPVTPD